MALHWEMCAICLLPRAKLKKQRSLHHSRFHTWPQAQLHSNAAISAAEPLFPTTVVVGTGHDQEALVGKKFTCHFQEGFAGCFQAPCPSRALLPLYCCLRETCLHITVSMTSLVSWGWTEGQPLPLSCAASLQSFQCTLAFGLPTQFGPRAYSSVLPELHTLIHKWGDRARVRCLSS